MLSLVYIGKQLNKKRILEKVNLVLWVKRVYIKNIWIDFEDDISIWLLFG